LIACFGQLVLERFEKLTDILLKHEDLYKRYVFKDMSLAYFDEAPELKD